jgi:REP element-mobilizing transposase RayT
MHNAIGTPLVLCDPRRRDHEQRLMKHVPVVLNDDARSVVGETISRHCEVRHWELHAINVRTNHVHVVVSCVRMMCRLNG